MRIVLTDGTIVVFFEGYFLGKNTFSAYGLYFLFIAEVSILLFNVCVLAVQFIYRYLILNRNIKISFAKYVFMLLPTFLAIFLITILTIRSSIKSLAMQQDITNKPELNGLINWNSETIYITFIRENDALSKASMYGLALLQAVAYVAIVYTAVKMVLFVRQQNGLPNIQDMNRQMLKNLIILASYPLFLAIINVFASIFSPVLNLSNFGDAQIMVYFFINLFSTWLPIFNPLSSILTIRSYRNALMEKIVRFRPGTTVHPVPSSPAIMVQSAATGNSFR